MRTSVKHRCKISSLRVDKFEIVLKRKLLLNRFLL